MRIALIYSLLAAIATAINISSQHLCLYLGLGQYEVPASILLGTATGLVSKYLLDKKFIFNYQTKNKSHEGALFALYAGTGIVTTLIFWGLEYAFHLVFQGQLGMRYLGGILGLSIGYAIKYQLDKRYVFLKESQCAN